MTDAVANLIGGFIVGTALWQTVRLWRSRPVVIYDDRARAWRSARLMRRINGWR